VTKNHTGKKQGLRADQTDGYGSTFHKGSYVLEGFYLEKALSVDGAAPNPAAGATFLVNPTPALVSSQAAIMKVHLSPLQLKAGRSRSSVPPSQYYCLSVADHDLIMQRMKEDADSDDEEGVVDEHGMF